MPDSPLQAVLSALDALDVAGAAAMFAPGGVLTTVFGERAEGQDRVRTLLEAFVQELRATKHALTREWNPDAETWIAAVTATYELADRSLRGPYERALILRHSGDGISELRIYGQHELPLAESGRPYSEVHGAHHGWLPTL